MVLVCWSGPSAPLPAPRAAARDLPLQHVMPDWRVSRAYHVIWYLLNRQPEKNLLYILRDLGLIMQQIQESYMTLELGNLGDYYMCHFSKLLHE